MPGDNIIIITTILQQYPNLLLFLVFLVAFTESLIVIGLIVPGAILMVMFGAMIALNVLSFWPAVFCAIAGAVAGDTLSYWLGHKYQHRLNSVWPLSRHPDLIIRANTFFSKHGVKSIIFSRFIGPLRPIIPAIAGMTGMHKNIFLMANISSAFVWAPLYLSPGILFGLSLDIASEFSSKFIFIVTLFCAGIFIALWLLQKIYIKIKPYSENLIANALNWSKKHPVAGQMPAAVFDSSHPEVRGLSLLALIILACVFFLSIVHATFTLPFNFDSINRLVFNSLHTFRSPPFDSLMLWAGNITNSTFISLVTLSFGLFLIIKNKLAALWHLLAAILLPLALSLFLQNKLNLELGKNFNIEFSSLPSVVLVSIIGISTLIFSSGFSSLSQKLFYYLSAGFVFILSLAQVYLALQVFSQILSGIVIGVLWISLLGIAYRKHHHSIETTFHTKSVFIVILLLTYPTWQMSQQKNLHIPPASYQLMGANSWLESGWELLPIQRQDIYSRETASFNIQWAGDEESIRAQLIKSDFQVSKNSFINFANWFTVNSEIQQLPILPHIHKGTYEQIRYYRYDKNEHKLMVIRLWKSPYQLSQNDTLTPLWFGETSQMIARKNLGLRYLITSNNNSENLNAIMQNNKLQISEQNIFDSKNKKTIKLQLIH